VSYNPKINSGVILICVLCLCSVHADETQYEVDVNNQKVVVATTLLYAQATPYVSLGDLLQDLGGVLQVTEEVCQANYQTTTAVIKPETVSVTAPGLSFSLQYPSRRHAGDIYLAQADVEHFFAQAYQTRISPVAGASTPDTSPPAEVAPLDEDPGSLLEVLPLPEPESPSPPQEDPAAEMDESALLPPTVEESAIPEAVSVVEGEVAVEATTGTDSELDTLDFTDAGGVLILDAGHGGQDTGIMPGESVTEKDFTLALLLKLRGLLKEQTSLTIHLTRESDKDLSLSARAKAANTVAGDLFVSIHSGYSTTNSTNGVVLFSDRLPEPPNAETGAEIQQAFTRRRNYGEQASKVAYQIAQALAEDNTLGTVTVRKAPLIMQRLCEMPCILVELAYLNHPDITASVTEETFQVHVAETLARAIIAALPQPRN
jgi:N-acetylmuramoyl-L-alanine amidase